MKTILTTNLIRPLVRGLQPYVPGEQPKVKGLIKLNTNENPYPPSPRVLAAVQAAVDGRLRRYPDPSADGLRAKLAKLHHCAPGNIIVGNGSDELLALATRAFVEPAYRWPGSGRSTRQWTMSSKSWQHLIQYFTPSYSLYPVLAAIQGAAQNPMALNPDFSLPSINELKRGMLWDFRAALTFITTPNAPSGRGYSTAELACLCRWMKGVVILDEAYAEFASEDALRLALEYPQVIVSRTFSKAYSLCFQRVGYFVGHPDLIGALHKLRDSYNVNGLGQVAAEATLDDLPYYRSNFKRLVTTREETSARLTELGFQVLPSQTNFLLVRPPRWPAEEWLERLRARKLLVRWFDTPELRVFLRVTIGTPDEMDQLIAETRRLLKA